MRGAVWMLCLGLLAYAGPVSADESRRLLESRSRLSQADLARLLATALLNQNAQQSLVRRSVPSPEAGDGVLRRSTMSRSEEDRALRTAAFSEAVFSTIDRKSGYSEKESRRIDAAYTEAEESLLARRSEPGLADLARAVAASEDLAVARAIQARGVASRLFQLSLSKRSDSKSFTSSLTKRSAP